MSDPVPAHFWERVRPDLAGADAGFSGLVLASKSPQRKLLLEQLGVRFRVVVSDHDEGVSDGDPAHTVQQNARGKAEEVLAREALRPGELVLRVDTVVVLDGEILGKTRDGVAIIPSMKGSCGLWTCQTDPLRSSAVFRSSAHLLRRFVIPCSVF